MAMPDINNLDLLNESVEVSGDVTPESFFSPPILDDGEHEAILHLGDRGIKADRQADKVTGLKTGPGYLNVHLQAKTVDDAGNERIGCFDNPTSIVMQSVGTSRLHMILDAAGHKAPNNISLGELKEHTELALAQSPKVKIATQWEASAKVETQGQADASGTAIGKYYTFLKGQKKFPPVLDENGNPTGKFQTQVQDPKTGLVGNAQVRIVKYARA